MYLQLMPQLIGQKVTDVLAFEGNIYKLKVVSNILKAKKNRSGETVRSIRVDTQNQDLIVWGRENFHNMETGISPQEMKASISTLSYLSVRSNIAAWSKYLPLEFVNVKERFIFASNVVRNIQEKGSLLFQQGGRKDIYSNEEEALLKNISDKVGQIIVNTQIL